MDIFPQNNQNNQKHTKKNFPYLTFRLTFPFSSDTPLKSYQFTLVSCPTIDSNTSQTPFFSLLQFSHPQT
jgi:hypothetical protein